MLNKSFLAPIISSIIILFLSNCSFAQSKASDLTTEKTGKCTFNGNAPFHSIKITNSSLIANNATGVAQILINSELDTPRDTFNADIVAVIESISASVSLLQGQEVQLQSKQFQFSISKTGKNNGRIIEITNKTPDGGRTDVIGSVLVTNFDRVSNKVSFVIKMVFDNTFKTIQKLNEDLKTDANGKVTVTCKFKDAPVSFIGTSSN